MKNLFAILICGLTVFMFSTSAFALSPECDQTHLHNIDENKEEQIVYISEEDGYLSYPMDEHYKYTFIYEPQSMNAVCYNCGNSTMGMITERKQYGDTPKTCPNGGLYLDDFFTWNVYKKEYCTSCGYKSTP